MKRKYRFSMEKVPLNSTECLILKVLLDAKMALDQKQLSKRCRVNISCSSKDLKKLLSKGLIYILKDAITFYGINVFRKKEIETFLTGYQFGKNKPLILSGHAFVYEAVIKDLSEEFLKKLDQDKSFIGFYPKGWRAGYKKTLPDGSFKFHKSKNSSKIYVYFRTFGGNPDTIEQINIEKFIDLKNHLEETYPGLKIGDYKEVAKCPWQEYALQKDRVAVAGIALGIKHKKIEKSYRYPEWEEKGINAKEKIKKIINLREKEVEDL